MSPFTYEDTSCPMNTRTTTCSCRRIRPGVKTPYILYIRMIPFIVATSAPIVNSIQLFPQLYKTYTTKSVRDLSFYSLLLILTTNILWLLHGYFIFDISLIAAGIFSMTINITLLTLYFLYKKGRHLK